MPTMHRQHFIERNNLIFPQNIITNSCKEKTEWVENTSDATTQDFITQRQNLDETITPIIQKLNEPSKDTLYTRIMCYFKKLK